MGRKTSNNEELTKELERLRKENERLQNEKYILERQVELKDQHLNLLLGQAPVALTAYNKEGFIELHVGRGLEIPGVDTKQISFLGMHIDMVGMLLPNVAQAVKKAFEGVITNAQTQTPGDHLFHSIYVPVKHHDQVEYVYAVSFRWPTESEYSEFMYKASLDVERFSKL